MKNSILILFACLVFQALPAQEIWLEAGLKGGYGMSFLYNKGLVDNANVNYKLTPMHDIGAKFAVNFGAFHGLALEGMFTKLGQDFDYAPGAADQHTTVNWKTTDAALLYRYVRNKIYLELGPQYAILRAVEHSDEQASVEPFYQKNYWSGIFGFGGYVGGAGTFSVELGIRLHYALTDFVNEEGQTLLYPLPNLGSLSADTTPTRPAYAEFMVAFNFGIGYFAKTSCQERMRFFSGR